MKRILIINTDSVNTGNATGITLQSIFGALNPENLMELYWGTSRPLTGSVKLKSRVLRPAPLSFAALFSNNRGRQISRSIKHSTAGTGGGARGGHKIVSDLRQFVALQTDLSRICLTKKDMQEIRAFAPEVIYTLGGGVASLKMAYRLSRKLRIPIVMHFMDNWRHCIQWEENPLLKHYKKQLRGYCNRCYQRSNGCIAISPKMAEVYTEETGIPHSTVMNAVNVSDFYTAPRPGDGVFRFVYAGGLHLGREKGLYRIAEAIREVAAEKNKAAEFLIYTSPENIAAYQDAFREFEEVRFLPAVPHDGIRKVFAGADFLVHTESNDLMKNEFFRYSISTKIPEYLASGRPVLFFGPSDIYLYTFLTEAGVAVTAPDADALSREIASALDGKYAAMPERAYLYAKEHFDVTVAVNTLCHVFENAGLEKKQ